MVGAFQEDEVQEQISRDRPTVAKILGRFASAPGSDVPPLLLKAARRLEPLDPGLARETYLDAWEAAQFAGHLAVGGDLLEVSRAARAMPASPRPPRLADLLLDGLSLLVTDGPAAAAPALRQAMRAFADPDAPVAERLRWGWMAPVAGTLVWDDEGWRLIERPVQLRPRHRRPRPAPDTAEPAGHGSHVVG